MYGVSVVESIKFGFRTFFKNILFFIGAAITTGFVAVVGFTLSVLVSMPFFLPVMTVLTKLREAVSEFVAPAQLGPTGEPLKMGHGKLLAVFSEIFTKQPLIFLSVVLGIVVFVFAVSVIHMMIYLGWIRIAINFRDKGFSTISSLFVEPILIMRAIAVSLVLFCVPIFFVVMAILISLAAVPALSALISVFALLMLFYLIFRFAFSYCFIVDKKVGAIESVKRSFTLKGGPSNFILLWLAILAINLFLGLTIGLISGFVRMPLIYMIFNMVMQFIISVVGVLSFVYIYRGLSSRQG